MKTRYFKNTENDQIFGFDPDQDQQIEQAIAAGLTEITDEFYAEQEQKKKEHEDYMNSYAVRRSREYPSIFDYIDGVVKNDQEQIQRYIDQCLAVKAKYPKP